MLEKFFISEVRISLLKLMLLHPYDQHHVRSIVRSIGAEINAVRRELDRLEKVGLLVKRRSSNRIYYRVNTDHVYYSDLLGIVAKDQGLGKDILDHLRQLGDIKFAMIAKPFLTGRVSTVLDVDLFIVGKPEMSMLKVIIDRAEEERGKEINYSVMSLQEFNHRKRTNDQFINRVLSQGRTMLVGNEEKFTSY